MTLHKPDCISNYCELHAKHWNFHADAHSLCVFFDCDLLLTIWKNVAFQILTCTKRTKLIISRNPVNIVCIQLIDVIQRSPCSALVKHLMIKILALTIHMQTFLPVLAVVISSLWLASRFGWRQAGLMPPGLRQIPWTELPNQRPVKERPDALHSKLTMLDIAWDRVLHKPEGELLHKTRGFSCFISRRPLTKSCLEATWPCIIKTRKELHTCMTFIIIPLLDFVSQSVIHCLHIVCTCANEQSELHRLLMWHV